MQSKSTREFPKNELDQIDVRPIHQEEKERFKYLLKKHHYLGSPPLIGQTIQYVASYRQHWVALLLFSAAALKNQDIEISG